MNSIGYSTGALALGDWSKALNILQYTSGTAVELSALREGELLPLINSLPSINLDKYSSISFHAPSKSFTFEELELVNHLKVITSKKIPIVVHPDIIDDFDLWNDFGELLYIENMDLRKSTGKDTEELSYLFEALPYASLCFDFGHAFQIDPTLDLANSIVEKFCHRIKLIHLSEVNIDGQHLLLTQKTLNAFSEVLNALLDIPVILESPARKDDIYSEIEKVRRVFSETTSYSCAVAI